MDMIKFKRTLFPSVFVFLCLNMLLLRRSTASIADTVIFYVINIVICALITFCFAHVLDRSGNKKSGFYALGLMLAVEPFFLINSMFESDYRRLAAFVLAAISVFLVRNKKTVYFVPLTLALMIFALPITVIVFAPFIVLLMYYEYMADEKRNDLPLIIGCSALILIIVILSIVFRSNRICILLFGHGNSPIDLNAFLNIKSFLINIFKGFMLAEFPIVAVLIMIWRKAVIKSKNNLILNFFCTNLIVSLISFLLVYGKFAYMLCGIQLIILIYLYVRGEREIVSGVDEAVTMLRSHPLTVIASVVWCASFKSSSYFATGIADVDGSAILSSISRFLNVNP